MANVFEAFASSLDFLSDEEFQKVGTKLMERVPNFKLEKWNAFRAPLTTKAIVANGLTLLLKSQHNKTTWSKICKILDHEASVEVIILDDVTRRRLENEKIKIEKV